MTFTIKLENGDIPFSSATGRPFEIDSTEKFKQDVRLVIAAANLDSLVGKLHDIWSLRAEITRRVTDACAAYKSEQDTVQKSDRLPQERFGRLEQVVVQPLIDPTSGAKSSTSYAYRLDFLSVKGVEVSITGTLVN